MSGLDNATANERSVRLANLRDLGGLPVGDDRVRTGVLFRADDVSRSPHDELVDLHDRGVRVVLDLRSLPERELSPGASDASDIETVHLPLLDVAADPASMASMLSDIETPGDMGRWYATIAEQSAPSIVRGLQIIVSHPDATLFHCAAGKDRTGVFAGAVLSVLGADTDVIVEDYARTAEVIDAVFARLATHVDVDRAATLDLVGVGHPLLSAHPDTMSAMLGHLDHEHGGFTALLGDAGLDSQLTHRLRDKLLDGASHPHVQ